MVEKDNTVQIKRRSQDPAFFNNVFKKIEKISSVVFYILSFKKDNQTDNLLITALEKKSFTLHEVSLAALSATEQDTTVLYTVQDALWSLLSTVEVATAARIIPGDLAALVSEQIDAVSRQLGNHYLHEAGVPLATDEVILPVASGPTARPTAAASTPAATPRTPKKRAARVAVPSGDISSDAYLVYSQLNDRTERIKTVLEAKPQATVKDIAEIITDVSEKTIQRDLNSLIEKGQVVREGERRWSKYSVVKD